MEIKNLGLDYSCMTPRPWHAGQIWSMVANFLPEPSHCWHVVNGSMTDILAPPRHTGQGWSKFVG